MAKEIEGPWEHHYAETNGIRMHYVKAGSGPPVFLLHGFPEFWYSWRHQIIALSKEFTVIAPDLRGYNLTDKPSGVRNYRQEVLAADILGLMDALGYEKARIAAHDWGGAIGWYLGYFHPDRVEQLSILNSPHPLTFQRHLKNNKKQRRRSWYMFYFQVPILPEFTLKIRLSKFIRDAFVGWAKNPEAFSEEDLKLYEDIFRPSGALTAAINYYRASVRDTGLGKIYPRSTPVDTLLIWGENDKALGIELTHNLEKYFEGPFKIEYIPNCSHWVQNDRPERVNELLMEFFQK